MFMLLRATKKMWDFISTLKLTSAFIQICTCRLKNTWWYYRVVVCSKMGFSMVGGTVKFSTPVGL